MEVKSRLSRVSLTIKQLCEQANVPRNTVHRWMRGAIPSLRTFPDYMGKLEAALGEHECELRDELIARHGLPEPTKLEAAE